MSDLYGVFRKVPVLTQQMLISPELVRMAGPENLHAEATRRLDRLLADDIGRRFPARDFQVNMIGRELVVADPEFIMDLIREGYSVGASAAASEWAERVNNVVRTSNNEILQLQGQVASLTSKIEELLKHRDGCPSCCSNSTPGGEDAGHVA